MVNNILAIFNLKVGLRGMTTIQKVICILYFPVICLMWYGICIKKYWMEV